MATQLHTDMEQNNIGVRLTAEGALVTVWAPFSKKLSLLIKNKEQITLKKQAFGFWNLQTDMLQEGDYYKFELDEETPLPDPASRHQPDGVHGYSEVINLNTHSWNDEHWRNPLLEDYVIYELHIGTFTPEGTFDATIDKLDYLKNLGITAIEIMPVAQFSGNRNWGYDGVFPFAVQTSYGGPKALQRLVDACHQNGIAVILDVVYNHLGPEGNYLNAYGPYFTDKYHTPWGKAMNLDDAYCDGVRHYLVENMLMWFRDFHIDALRLDAVHALKDFSAKHVLVYMRNALDQLSSITNQAYYLIGECDLNDVRYIRSEGKGGYGLHAQWIDEFHHALRVSVGEPREGYYSDFEPLVHLAKSLTDAYVYDGLYSIHRKKTFGNQAIGATGAQFVAFSQNHDQVGNRLLGERSSTLYSKDTQLLMAAVVLAAPFIPMLFMGEEYGEKQPFQYFASYADKELADSVRKGRRKEFNDFHGEEEVPDPMAAAVFERSKLRWSCLEEYTHQQIFEAYKKLIALRKKHPAWHILDRERLAVKVLNEEQVLVLNRWNGEESLFFYFNFDTQRHDVAANILLQGARKIFDTVNKDFLEDYTETLMQPQVSIAPRSASIYQKSRT